MLAALLTSHARSAAHVSCSVLRASQLEYPDPSTSEANPSSIDDYSACRARLPRRPLEQSSHWLLAAVAGPLLTQRCDRSTVAAAPLLTQRCDGSSLASAVSRGDIHLVLMFSNQFSERILQNYAIRRLAVDFGVPLITNVQVANMFAEALECAGATATGETANTNVVLDSRSLHEWYA
jgi:hypothetical protein